MTVLWLRLSTVAIIALLFYLALLLPERVAGWSFYLSTADVVFEIALYAVFVALTGVALGALVTVATTPFLLLRRSSRRRLVENITRAAVAIAAFVDLGIGLNTLLEGAGLWRIKSAVLLCYFIAFAVAMCIPRRREQVVTTLDGFLSEKATRRAVLGTGAAAAALVLVEAAIGKTESAAVTPKRALRPSGPNIVLVTFDALSAEDLSVYGYRLPTTPHIDEFARHSSVFTNFYSGSTFTTPSIATMLTGLQPSEHHVHQLQGHLRGGYAVKTLPHAMRAGGYSTGASVSNPHAYFLADGIAEDYDALPDPAYSTPALPIWDATGILHQRQPLGSRAYEFQDLEKAWGFAHQELARHRPRLFASTKSEFPPAGSFDQARAILRKLPDGFFLWVHLYAPHMPYLPGAPYLGRFLASGAMRTGAEQGLNLGPVYSP